jgi:hypothetical protein
MTPTEIVLKAILDRKPPDPATLPPAGSYRLELSLRVDGESVRLCGMLDGQLMMVRLGTVPAG